MCSICAINGAEDDFGGVTLFYLQQWLASCDTFARIPFFLPLSHIVKHNHSIVPCQIHSPFRPTSTLIKKISCSLACKPYPPKLTKHYWSIALFLSFGFLFSMISFHVEDETNHFTISALSMLLQGKVFDMDQLVCGTSASHKTTNKKLKQFLWRMYICFCTLLIHGACIRCLFLSFFWVNFM